MRTPFLAFAKNDQDLEVLKAFAAANNWQDSSVMQGDISSATEFLANHPACNILLVEIPDAQAAPGLLEGLAKVCDPDTKVVIIGNINEYSFFTWLQDIGIFHYLLRPLTHQALEAMYKKATTPVGGAAAVVKEPGKIIGVIGTRGGCGSSSIALLLSALMAQKSTKNVMLLDADPQDGSAALLLDLEPSRGFREGIEKPDRMDEMFLERVIVKVGDRLNILSAEESIGEQIDYNEEAADVLIPLLKHKYDVVFLDLPRSLNAFNRKCIRMCDKVLIVTELSLQGLRDAMRMQEWMKEKLKIAPPLTIANKVDHEKKYQVDTQDFEKSLNGKVEFKVGYDPEIFMEINADLKVLGNEDNDVIQELISILKTIDPAIDQQDGEEEGKKGKSKKAKPGFLKKK